MTAKIVESLWLRRSWRAKFSFSFAAEEGTVFLRYLPFFFLRFASLHVFGMVCTTFNMDFPSPRPPFIFPPNFVFETL